MTYLSQVLQWYHDTQCSVHVGDQMTYVCDQMTYSSQVLQWYHDTRRSVHVSDQGRVFALSSSMMKIRGARNSLAP